MLAAGLRPLPGLSPNRLALNGALASSGGGVSAYDTAVLADTPTYFWTAEEASGTTAADSAGSNTGTYTGGFTLGATGIGDGKTAVTFNGSTGLIQTASSITAPAVPFSLECWVKTANAYSSGGVLVSFGDHQAGSGSAAYDRELWMDNAGLLHFHVFNGGDKIASSTAAYNDGAWHYVVATIHGTLGMVLYVDGSSVGTNANTGDVSYTGFWHVGAGTITAVPTPTSTFLAGTIAKAAIYNGKTLTSTQVAAHYAAA